MRAFMAGLETKIEFSPELLADAHRRVGNVLEAMSPPVNVEKSTTTEDQTSIEVEKICVRKEVAVGNERPQKSDEHACRFCAKYTGSAGWVQRHEIHCKSNPNRTPHPKEGKPTPWLRRRGNASEANSSPSNESDNSSLSGNESSTLDEETATQL